MKPYSYEDLVQRLTNLRRLATPPIPGEKAGLQSSTDKRSRYDAENDRYIDWDANADADGVVRVQEDGGRVLAEMDGPGCLWRIWFAAPEAEGSLKIYLDGEEQPTIDCPAKELFGGGAEPFVYPNLCYEEAGGFNCYVPISYSTGCKVVGYGNFGAFYQFSYSRLGHGAQVETLCLPLTPSHRLALQQANDALGAVPPSMQDASLDGPDTQKSQGSVSIPAGECVTVWQQQGAGAITLLRLRPGHTAWAALKKLVLQLYWDGEDTPAVWAPLCDFFGGACGKNDYTAYPMGICEDGWFYSRWFMPFTNGARLLLQNSGQHAMPAGFEVCTVPLAAQTEPYLRFHAKWHRGQPAARADRKPDYTLLQAEGEGRFLGCALHVYKPADNRDLKCIPGEYWWGEGDEKFFVDSEKFPSVFGTGTEDYFGFAWAWPDLFGRPYHVQNFNQGGIHNRGNRSFARFHIADDIPFFTSLEASLEKYYDENFSRYAITPYWYGPAGQADLYGVPRVEALTGYYVEDPENHPEYTQPGLLFAGSTFPQGNLDGWSLEPGAAFENAQVRPCAVGNCFTYATSVEDAQPCALSSPRFVLEGSFIEFWLGGTWQRDPDISYAALVRASDGATLAASCCQGEDCQGEDCGQPRLHQGGMFAKNGLRRVVWDVRDYVGEECFFKIIDEGKGGKRQLSFTGLRAAGRIL